MKQTKLRNVKTSKLLDKKGGKLSLAIVCVWGGEWGSVKPPTGRLVSARKKFSSFVKLISGNGFH